MTELFLNKAFTVMGNYSCNTYGKKPTCDAFSLIPPVKKSVFYILIKPFKIVLENRHLGHTYLSSSLYTTSRPRKIMFMAQIKNQRKLEIKQIMQKF